MTTAARAKRVKGRSTIAINIRPSELEPSRGANEKSDELERCILMRRAVMHNGTSVEGTFVECCREGGHRNSGMRSVAHSFRATKRFNETRFESALFLPNVCR